MKQIYFLILISFIIIQNHLLSQSQFATKEEVAEYLEGEWNLDVVQGGFAGSTYYLPSPNYYDSSYHRIVFEKTNIDTTPILCKALINDTLYQETYIKIQENPSQAILPRWLLYDLPDNLEVNVKVMESIGFYGFSQDTIVLGGNTAFDGYDFGLKRLTSSIVESENDEEIKIYPNPTNSEFIIEGVDRDTPYQVFEANGRLVTKGNLIANSIELPNINGTLILKLKMGDQWITRKIVKME